MDDPFSINPSSSQTTKINSPYLNFDPTILKPSGSQFIIPEGQGEHRGRMEMAFSTIGSSVGIGGLFGGINGLYRGVKDTQTMSGKIRRTQILNFVAKQSATSAQACGAIALLFSLYDTAFSLTRDVDDELNKLGAAFVTGATYTFSQGYKKSLRGGVIGLALVAGYYGITNYSKLKSRIAN